jgi:anti-anti-sigma factor
MIQILKLEENHLLVCLEKDILMENSKEFFDKLEFIKKNHEPLKIISMDFKNVQFMDSSGIGTLIRFTTNYKKDHLLVNIFGLNKNLLAVFQLSGLTNIINLFTTNDFFNQYSYLNRDNE